MSFHGLQEPNFSSATKELKIKLTACCHASIVFGSHKADCVSGMIFGTIKCKLLLFINKRAVYGEITAQSAYAIPQVGRCTAEADRKELNES